MFNQNSAVQQSHLSGLGMLAAFWGLFISVVFMAGVSSFSISGALLTVLFVLLLEFGGVLLTARDRVDGYVPFIVRAVGNRLRIYRFV